MRVTKFLPEILKEQREPDWKSLMRDLVPSKGCVNYLTKKLVDHVRTGKYEVEEKRPQLVMMIEMLFGKLFFTDVGIFFANVLCCYDAYGDEKVHLFEDRFFEKFKKVCLDKLRFADMPEFASGFVQLPSYIKDDDGDELNSFWYYIGPFNKIPAHHRVKGGYPNATPDDSVIFFAWIDKNYNRCYTFKTVPKDKEIRLSDAFKGKGYKKMEFLVDHPEEKTIVGQDFYVYHVPIMLNTVAYLHSGKPDIREFVNEVRLKSASGKEILRADKDLSQAKIMLIGYNWLKDKNYQDDSWSSAAHLGWRYCGEGRKELRLVWVKGSVKKWQSPDVAAAVTSPDTHSTLPVEHYNTFQTSQDPTADTGRI